ncbi:hypothetical protein B0H34DRAFT_392809 [Crassisporium funariophilum]|nr:hypothetical protein B0H34DRAFT_392809 [Crassisporium funariophilum]
MAKSTKPFQRLLNYPLLFQNLLLHRPKRLYPCMSPSPHVLKQQRGTLNVIPAISTLECLHDENWDIPDVKAGSFGTLGGLVMSPTSPMFSLSHSHSSRIRNLDVQMRRVFPFFWLSLLKAKEVEAGGSLAPILSLAAESPKKTVRRRSIAAS